MLAFLEFRPLLPVQQGLHKLLIILILLSPRKKVLVVFCGHLVNGQTCVAAECVDVWLGLLWRIGGKGKESPMFGGCRLLLLLPLLW